MNTNVNSNVNVSRPNVNAVWVKIQFKAKSRFIKGIQTSRLSSSKVYYWNLEKSQTTKAIFIQSNIALTLLIIGFDHGFLKPCVNFV